MATKFTVREIVEAALRRVGEFAPHDPGSDPDAFSIAVDNLDRMLAHYAAIMSYQFMVKSEVAISIPINTNPLNIVSIAGTGLVPTGDFMAIDNIWLRKDGRDYPLTRISRREYLEMVEKKSGAGFPGWVYVDKTEQAPRVHLYPVLALAGYELAFTYFAFTDNVSDPVRLQGPHGFGPSWQLWMDTQLSYIIGSGPVVRVESEMLTRWRNDAAEYREQLFGSYNRETKRPRRVEANDF